MPQGRLYTVSFTEVAITTAVDMFEIAPADDKPCLVVGLFIGQSTDFAEQSTSQAEQIPFRVIRGHTTSGSGGAAAAEVDVGKSGTAAGFVAETNNTTAATAGTTVDLHCDVWNVFAGYPLWLPEGCEWPVSQADTSLVVRLASAPADSLDVSATLYVVEQG